MSSESDPDAEDASAERDGGYVHRPDGATVPETTAAGGGVGWPLVALVFVAFLLVPGAIYLYPVLLGTFGLSFVATYLLLPLLPAVGLGLFAVWSMRRAGDADAGE